MVSFSSYTSVTVKKGAAASFTDPTGMKYGFNLPGIFEIVKNPKLGTSGFDWEVDPAGTRLILEDVAQHTELPLYHHRTRAGIEGNPGYPGRDPGWPANCVSAETDRAGAAGAGARRTADRVLHLERV